MFTFTGDHTNLRGTMPRGPVFCGLLIVLSLGAHHVAAAPLG